MTMESLHHAQEELVRRVAAHQADVDMDAEQTRRASEQRAIPADVLLIVHEIHTDLLRVRERKTKK